MYSRTIVEFWAKRERGSTARSRIVRDLNMFFIIIYKVKWVCKSYSM
jgi:hypothetical protein